MRKSFKLIVLAALLPLALLGQSSPASAATVLGGLVQGAGGISPGLTATPTAQTFSFTGSITVGGTVAANGTDLAGSLAEGAGFVNLTAPASCTGVFVRVGAAVVAAFADASVCIGGGVFAFVPGQTGLPPEAGGSTVVTSYTLIGAGAGAQAP